MAKGKGSDDRSTSPSEDLKAHAVALSDCSEMSYAGSPMSAGSSQTHNHGTSSIPEEREVCRAFVLLLTCGCIKLALCLTA